MNYRPLKYLLLLTSLLLLACGKQSDIQSPDLADTDSDSEYVIRSREFVTFPSNSQEDVSLTQPFLSIQLFKGSQISNNLGILGPLISIDNSEFVRPVISNKMISFGSIRISNLVDNDLRVCGSNGKRKCRTAIIRTYTTGTDKAGIYNSNDDFGAPLMAGQSKLAEVGLNVSGALILQSITIPNSKNSLRISDFENPKYKYQADFTNAGAGEYSATIVIEYVLKR